MQDQLLVIRMQAGPPVFLTRHVALRWSDLANRRRSYFIELYQTGRWKLYYTEAEFVLQMREVFQAAERWEKLAAAHRAKQTR